MTATSRAVPLLDTKLEPPALPGGVVDRARVSAIFADAAATLTLIVGGPGFGKTIAARQIVASLPVPCGWVSLDAVDDESSGLWAYVIEATRRSVGIGDEAAAMLADEASATSFLTSLLGELGDVDAAVVLVLDDLHVIKSTDLLAQLTFFIERLPEHVRVIATSRVDPQLPIARWRLDGRVAEIRQDALRFSPDEAVQLVHAVPDLDLDRADVETIVERTEGWAAGLQLTLLSLRGRKDARAFLHEAFPADRMISDYLLSEVLDQLDGDDRRLLLELSVLEDFDADLAVFVTEQPDAGQRLRSLEASGLLVLPVDEGRRRLRFHQLLRELLQQELRWREPERLPALHARAGKYLIKNGHPRLALQHFVAANRLDDAFAVIADATLSSFDQGDGRWTRHWLGQFPTAFIEGDLQRMLSYSALLVVAGRPEVASTWLERAEASVDEATHRQALEILAQRTILHFWHGDAELAERSGNELLALLGDEPFDQPIVDRIPGMLARVAVYDDDLERAAHWLEVAKRAGGVGVVPELVPRILDAALALAIGDLRAAGEHATAALEWAAVRDLHVLPAVGEAHDVLARVRYEQGDLAGAEASNTEALEVMAELRITQFEVRQRMLGARIGAARFGPTAGLEVLRTSRAALADRYLGATARHIIAATEADLRLRDGDLDGALALIDTLPERPATTLLRCRALHRSGHFDTVNEILGDLSSWPVPARLDALLLLARCRHGRDASELVRAAAELGIPLGYVRPFLEPGPDLLRLVRAANRTSPTPELEMVLHHAAPATADPSGAPAATFAATLTDREEELLRLLPTHLTYREMADELCVSINTLKSYQKTLFRKLQVPSRSDAVAVGRSTGLIAS